MVENNKYCAICVNDMHLVVMLVPYIERELERGEKIVTILEKSLKNDVDTLTKKVNLGKDKKAKIKKINWNENILTDEEIYNIKDKTVLIKGSYDFIKRINKLLNGDVKRVINCFELDIFEDNSREILQKHDFILNTVGCKKISEMFHTNGPQNSILTKQF
ncbi:MAG: hypothetical protein ACI4VN_04530 [Clostridia bacterium]